MDKQGLDYPVCPYCGTKTNMTTEIENADGDGDSVIDEEVEE